ncbi:acyltransferase-domain-containing protein [Piptocephalis cylindrospora]|uniref:Acyltransferase-domain-containing protein n=1 Tax=Piptocephalis cylindrospora TaxID=1907219 RepID=A0A4P9Y2L4_9FUNG|nr:acyltransferase-domain-containing protein [Piptocephalis cylindrospora]|eukprot:RKP12924.1 acyltransferase-domain-containing protein [Piptocephalis cylindrospora]
MSPPDHSPTHPGVSSPSDANDPTLTGPSPPATENEEKMEMVLQRNLGSFRADPLGFVYRLTSEGVAFHRGSGWRSYEDYVGTRLFHPRYTEEMRDHLLRSDKVQACIRKLAQHQAAQILVARAEKNPIKASLSVKAEMRQRRQMEKELDLLARRIIGKLIANLNSIRPIKLMAFGLGNILARLYHEGITIHHAEYAELRKQAVRAAARGQSLIVVPSHRSHIDYLLISIVFYRLGLALPHIAAGDNINFPIAGTILRKGGAFYIRRSWSGDSLYNDIVTEYVETLLKRGHNIEFFIEGTRSRTGKLLNPRFGLLKMILDSVVSGRVDDCIIVPMSLGYDRVIETASYVDELLGKPKEKESLWRLFSSSHHLQLKWGRVDVRFAKPYSLKEYIQGQMDLRSASNSPPSSSPFDPKDDGEDRRVLLRSLGYRILSDINSASVVMPTALVGTAILTIRGRGVGRRELIRRVEWLRREVFLHGGRVAHFAGKPVDEIVDRALKVLRELVGVRKALLEPVYYAASSTELSYYRNQVIHLFISESIVSVAMYARIKVGGAWEDQKIPQDDLIQSISFLSQLLKGEFIYNPGGVDVNVSHTLRSLEDAEIIQVDDKGVELSPRERAIGRENYDFYCFLLWPFIESYWLAAVSLFSLVPSASSLAATQSVEAMPMGIHLSGKAWESFDPKGFRVPSEDEERTQTGEEEEEGNNGEEMVVWVDEKAFMDQVLILGKTLYYQGDLSYLESINKETLKNAYNWFKTMGMLMVKPKTGNKEGPAVAIHPACVPERHQYGALLPQGQLWSLVDRIGQFRREGKNRRDNATVSTRVLALADLVGTRGWNPDASKLSKAADQASPPAKL